MLKRLIIKNFKSLIDTEINFTPLSVFIGANSSGKSSILQALDLIRYFGLGKTEDFLKERKWIAKDLGSKLTKDRYIEFALELELPINNKENCKLYWNFTLNPSKKLKCVWEILSTDENSLGDPFLKRNSAGDVTRLDATTNKRDNIPPIEIRGSALSLLRIDDKEEREHFPEQFALLDWLNGIYALEVLNPSLLREDKFEYDNIEREGKGLASNLHKMSKEEKEKIYERLREFYNPLKEIKKKKRKTGRIKLSLNENYANDINASHISDGLLRLLTFAILEETKSNNQTIIIDEIENGISPYLASDLMTKLSEMSKSR